jgi:hypothetical protein
MAKPKQGIYRWKKSGKWKQVTKTMNLCKKLFERDKARGVACEYGELIDGTIPSMWVEESANV